MGKSYEVFDGIKENLEEGEPKYFLKSYKSRSPEGIITQHELVKIERVRGRIKESYGRKIDPGVDRELLQKFLNAEKQKGEKEV